MEELPQDRAYLESLTTDELVKLADNHGIDIPPGLDRAIIIEELWETLNENDIEEELPVPVPLVEKRRYALASIPKQYNITFIEVLIRDPLWAFAYWEVNTRDKDIYEKNPDFNGYFLKVSSASAAPADPDSSFTVPVGIEDSAWYLGFPPGGGTFTVELLAALGEKNEVLGVSSQFRLPKLLGAKFLDDKSLEIPAGPLVQLSGSDDFDILRNTQRLSRLPKHDGVQGQM